MKSFKTVFSVVFAAALVAMCGARVAQADTDVRQWQGVNGEFSSDFSDVQHWSGDSGAPDASDTVEFNADKTYTVTFTKDEANMKVLVTDGDVTFNLNGHRYQVPVYFTVDGKAKLTITGGDKPHEGWDLYTGGLPGINPGIGNSEDANAQVVVTGKGTEWSVGYSFYVGDEGTGKLTVENGGSVYVQSSARLGYHGGTGTVIVSGAGSSWSLSNLSMGAYNGTGIIKVLNGGSASSNRVGIGGGRNGVGELIVSGKGSTYNARNRIVVGTGGSGTLLIDAGGVVKSATDNMIASHAASSGTATVSDQGSKWDIATSLYVGGTASNAGGVATLNINDGAAVSVGINDKSGDSSVLKVWKRGTVNLDGSGMITAPMFTSAGGTINVSHTDNTISGDVSLDGETTVNMTLTDDKDYAQLDVGGTLKLNGTLNVRLGENYTPEVNDSYDLFDWQKESGTFIEVNLPKLGMGLSWDQSDLYKTGVVKVVQGA